MRTYTGTHSPESVVKAARVAMRERRNIKVCAWCQGEAIKLALKDYRNVSHGICPACALKVMAEMKAQKEAR